ncbi:MAG: hypothetical protein R6X02_27850 [Enhygromyxa sp.]
MAKLHSALLALFTAILLMTGCSKSVEGETKSWNANVKTVNELMAQYPGMKPALEARLEAAKTKFDAASDMSGDEQINQMAAANSAIMADFVRDLKGLDAKLKKLRTAAAEVATKAGDESSRQGAKIAAEDAQKTIARVEKTLADGAADEAAAAAVMKKVIADIETAQSVIDKVAKADKDKTNKKAADEKTATEKAAADKAAAEAKVADWTCEYCDAKNKHDVTTCSGCGAARPAK